MLLITPVILLYLGHFLCFLFQPGLIPTGFLQFDQPFYMAAAREYFDQDGFSFLYSNPADPSIDSPRIYFQLPILLLAVILKLTGLDPGLVLTLFGLVCAWGCAWLGIRFWKDFTAYESFSGHVGLWLFTWGGGLLVLAGFVFSLVHGSKGFDLFHFDPSQGWWFLNWGRNLVLPLEAFYHLLFLAMIRQIFVKKYYSALFFAAILTVSHPFTGLQALLIFLAWTSLESFVLKNREIPPAIPLLPALLLTADLFYYLGYLNSFPEHRSVYEQWKLKWELSVGSAVFAYCLVALPFFRRIRSIQKFTTFIAQPFPRLLLTWSVISLLLVFHQMIIPAHQPLHFTRGYIWLPFFLLGYPVIRHLLDKILNFNAFRKIFLLTIFLFIFFLDNTAWFLTNIVSQAKGSNLDLTKDKTEVIDYLNTKGDKNTLVISDDARLGYFSIVYTPVRAVYSHWGNTPLAADKVLALNVFRMEGKIDPAWQGRKLVFVRYTNRPVTQQLTDKLNADFQLVTKNSIYEVYQIKP
ncbi:MAG: hypothetical protein NTU44_01020 [Bacteroidetes bacterium]|nr:hypothetical protein [Bacteroidota bacterium]